MKTTPKRPVAKASRFPKSRQRPEYRYIAGWIKPGSSVLDIGCGEGALGEMLILEKKCRVTGLDISKDNVEVARKRGVKAKVADLDLGLKYPDKSFDYVVINVTLQMLHKPDKVLADAARVGKALIVSFPNFAHILARMEMVFLGVMPRTPLYTYSWYDTRHIHMFSYVDFLDLCKRMGIAVKGRKFLFCTNSERENILSTLWPNLFSGVCILLLEP